MRLSVECPKCSKSHRIAEQSLGRRARCSDCGHVFTLSVSAEETVQPRPRPQANDPPGEPAQDQPDPALKSPPQSTSDQADLPQKIGHYVVRRKLGAGAMGDVYLAHDPKLRRQVAIKVLPASLSGDKVRLKRFLREARSAANLHHTNAATVYQIDAQGRLAYIVMEYVDGGSLQELVARHGPMNWRDATRAIRDAAAGLAAAHELGLVHRDIKPANLMQTAKGVTKVVDFGLARPQEQNSQLTQQEILGTPAYMAPEQWIGSEIDGRSDFYSLICTYYYLLTGHVPFDAPSLPALGYQHRYEPFPDPRKLAPGLPDEVWRVMARGTAKERADRYQTAAELLADLDALLATPQHSLAFDSPWEGLAATVTADAGSPLPGKLPRGRSLWPATARRGLAAWAKRLRTPLGIATACGAAVAATLVGAVLYIATNYGTVKIELLDTTAPLEVKIDGDTVEIAGLDKPLRLKVGDHILLVSSDEFTSVSQSFTVRRAKEEVLRVSLRPAAAPATVSPPGPPVAPSPQVDSSPKLTVDGVTPSSKQPPPQPQQPPPSTDPSTTPLAQLPAIEPASVNWTPSQDASATAIHRSRESALRGLTEYSWSSLLRGQYGIGPGMVPPPSRPSRPGARPPQSPLPDRFVLTGLLGPVRIQDGKTVLYLLPDDTRLPPVDAPLPDALAFASSGPVWPAAAIEFPTDQMALCLADYRLGEPVRAVVQRQSWTKTQGSDARRVYPYYGSMPPMMQMHPDELRPIILAGHGYPVRPCWCFRGQGLEKPNLPETWIDPSLGRAGKPADPDALSRCLGLLLRNAHACGGTAGRLTAKLSRIAKSRDASGWDLTLTAAGTSEGSVSMVAHLGPSVQPTELLDYKLGQLVEAAITLVGPEDPLSQGDFPPGYRPSPRSPDAPALGEPLPFWVSLQADCSQVQAQGDPSTLVSVRGPRRTNVAVSPDMPDVAVFDPDRVLGKEATWSGTLYRLRRQNGETHLVLSLTGSLTGLRYFEAFTSEQDFFDGLADYVPNGNDKVSVRGTICPPGAASFRLQTGAPLLEIKELARQGQPDSRVVVGRKRPPSMFSPGTAITGLAALLRDWPPLGTEVKLTGSFDSYDTSGKDLKVRLPSSGGNTYDSTVVVRFPRSNQAMFADYRNGDEVEVTATVDAHGQYLTLLGRSIVQSANPNSLVTDTGRKIPAMDFSVEKDQWSGIRYRLKENLEKKVRAWGYFGGISRSPGGHRITVTKLFGDSGGDLTLNCAGPPNATQFLQQLKSGEEVFFEFSVEGGDSKPVGRLLKIARVSDPDNPVEFPPANSE